MRGLRADPGEVSDERGEGEAVVGVDAELGVDEEENSLLDGVQSGNGSAVGTRYLHLHLGLHVHVDAKEDVLAAVRARGQGVDRTRIR